MRLRDPNACPERGDTVVGDCRLRATVAHRVSLAGLSDRLEFMAQRGVPIDTMPDALRAQAAVWRAMTGAQRVELAWSMSEELRSLSMQGIRARNPEFSDAETREALLRILYGDEIVSAMSGEQAADRR